ncbi:MAG: hypothetical protein NTW10_11465 [Bacteroidetes bacterium]|nr:hypothetical protein [Bacteroidota bacterium]
MKMKILLPLALIGLMIACGPSTQISKSWTDPSWKPGSVVPFKKVLVIAALKNESSRRIAEDKIVAAIKKIVAVQSYNYIQPTETDQNMLEAKLKKDGFDGLILMRLQDVDKSVSYTPGTSYGGWYGYRHYDPGYYSEDKTFYVETNFYSLDQQKLLWSGTTSTLNPTQVDQTISDIITAIKNELISKGLIPADK